MKASLAGAIAILLIFSGCEQSKTRQTEVAETPENSVNQDSMAAIPAECYTSYFTGEHIDMQATLRPNTPSSGDYKVTATVTRPATGTLTYVTSKLHVFEDTKSQDKNKEVIRVREIIFDYRSNSTPNPTGYHVIPRDSVKDDEAISVRLIGDTLGILYPKNPKVVLVRHKQ